MEENKMNENLNNNYNYEKKNNEIKILLVVLVILVLVLIGIFSYKFFVLDNENKNVLNSNTPAEKSDEKVNRISIYDNSILEEGAVSEKIYDVSGCKIKIANGHTESIMADIAAYYNCENTDEYKELFRDSLWYKEIITYKDLIIFLHNAGAGYNFYDAYEIYKLNNNELIKLTSIKTAKDTFKIENGKIYYITTQINFGVPSNNGAFIDEETFNIYINSVDDLEDIVEAKYEITYDDLIAGKDATIAEVILTKQQVLDKLPADIVKSLLSNSKS